MNLTEPPTTGRTRPPAGDQWSPEDFAGHTTAEGIEIHATPRRCVQAVADNAVSIALLGAAANAALEVADKCK
jgi:hypothetical protein